MNKYIKHLIVEKLKGLALQIKAVKQEFVTAVTNTKYQGYSQLPSAKHRLGEEARYQHLAYTFLRGIPYKVCENKCAEANKVNLKKLNDTIQTNLAFGYDWYLTQQSKQENLEKWLDGETIQMKQKPYVPKTREQLVEKFPHLKIVAKQKPITKNVFGEIITWFLNR